MLKEMDARGARGPSADTELADFLTPQHESDSRPSLPMHDSSNTSNMTDVTDDTAAVANGVRSSPSPSIPNGKPASPFVKESTPLGANVPQTVSSKDPKAAAAAANDMRNVVRRKLTGYVGFANLPNQWHRKSVRKGFNFNVMVVGMCEVLVIADTLLTRRR
jgi:septin 7